MTCNKASNTLIHLQKQQHAQIHCSLFDVTLTRLHDNSKYERKQYNHVIGARLLKKHLSLAAVLTTDWYARLQTLRRWRPTQQ
jgi:hypothetical protein